jgi:hypothetical protein
MTEKREIQGDNDLRLSSIARIVQISRLASGVNPLKSSKNSSITQQRGPQRARPGRTPSTGRRSGGDVQGLGGVAQRHSGEEPHFHQYFHQFRSDGELVRQSVEGVVELEEVVVAVYQAVPYAFEFCLPGELLELVQILVQGRSVQK